MKVVHCHGVRFDTEDQVYIGRPSIFGNPFLLRREILREEIIHQFREYFLARIKSDAKFRKQVETLRGKDLACWCAPKPCHGDVILEYLESL